MSNINICQVMEEAFYIFFNGKRVFLEWDKKPSRLSAIRRICSITPLHFLLLDQNKYLYEANFDGHIKVQLSFLRNDVEDISYSRDVRKLYIVTENGCVLTQQVMTTIRQDKVVVSNDLWQSLAFDPLEMFENGVCIKRVCCSSDGTLFVSAAGDIYALGNCGVHFSVYCDQPKLVRLFKRPVKILDLNAGDKFFVFLARNEADEELSLELPDPVCSGTNPKKEPSSPSMHSSISNYTLESNIQDLIKQGHSLLHTEVYTMGSVNTGLLGTGDHIKRDYILTIEKLQDIGVCSMSTGRDHTVVRTIDGSMYHWGLNSQQQLSTNSQLYELSSPTELTFDSSDSDEPRMNILETCCGDYRTVLLNSKRRVYENTKQLKYQEKDFVSLHMNYNSKQTYPLLLTSSRLTIYNHRDFKIQFQTLYRHLQLQTKAMMIYRKHIHHTSELATKTVLKDFHKVCHQWEHALYLIIGILNSLEQFYRSDYDDASQLVVIRYIRECIQIFEKYSKSYCDIYSIGGFHEAQHSLKSKTTTVPLSKSNYNGNNIDILKIFQQPFQVFPYVTQLLETIEKSEGNCNSELQTWLKFVRQNRIDLELAENTCEFWRTNQNNTKLFNFKQKARRVILSSTAVPIKLPYSMGLTTPIFILFSDCLCQVVNHVITFPLDAMWLKKDNTGITIKTPEKKFLLISKNHHDIDLWYDQLESSIKNSLNLSENSMIPEVRSVGYKFSSNHSTYASVYVKGSFSNGVMHGKCRLEFPSGKCYAGNIIHGIIEGYGRMFLPNVGLYKGCFKKGKFCGHGTLIISEKEMYEGNFRNGLFHGHGHLQHSEYVYVGEFEDNLKCGYGVLDLLQSGDKYLGIFSDNKKLGSGICITSSGNYFEGFFANEELTGKSIAMFPNSFFYEGELSLIGPNGTGKYYMPCYQSIKQEHTDSVLTPNWENNSVTGNILIGQLSGTWDKVRINVGAMEINTTFSKYPSSLGCHVVNNARKWYSLFVNFEHELFGDLANATNNSKAITLALWNRVVSFINKQQEIANETVILRDLDITDATSSSTMNNARRHFWPLHTIASDCDQISLNSSLFGFENHELNKTHSLSEDALNGLDFFNFDVLNTFSKSKHVNGDKNHTLSTLMNVMENWSTTTSMDTFMDECISLQTEMDLIPPFGLYELNEPDLSAIKEYLKNAFRYRCHPLKHLNDRITNAFYRSYGCWKIKPTPFLAKQAMREWESISQRVYKIIRRLFPALPEEYAIVGEKQEVVSHITLLYPILLSEDIYSFLFVLYANKYSHKDEVYRQNLLQAETLNDEVLVRRLEFDNDLLSVVSTEEFAEAILMLKELKDKYSPMAMLTVIENCMDKLTHAYQQRENQRSLNADVIVPLTLILLMRAGIHHLGAELALLDDLTDTNNFQLEMNGSRGYCYTTLKASYEHLASKSLFDNN